MLKLETIMNDTIWVAKMNWGRMSGTYKEMESYASSEECRDFDICAVQPEHLKDFYDKYFEYSDREGFITIQDYYNKYYNPTDGKLWSPEEIKEKILSDTKWTIRGLLAIYRFQTTVEKQVEGTLENNNVGFNGADGNILSGIAKWYLEKGFLTEKQLYIVRKRLGKYSGQLARIANNKQ